MRVIVCHWSRMRPVFSSNGRCLSATAAGGRYGVGTKRARPSSVGNGSPPPKRRPCRTETRVVRARIAVAVARARTRCAAAATAPAPARRTRRRSAPASAPMSKTASAVVLESRTARRARGRCRPGGVGEGVVPAHAGARPRSASTSRAAPRRAAAEGALARDAALGIGDRAVLLAPAGGRQQDMGEARRVGRPAVADRRRTGRPPAPSRTRVGVAAC